MDFEIKSCLEYFIKKGKCSNSIRYRRDILGNKLKDIFSSIIPSLSFHIKEKEVYKATEESTIMFARRMSIAFPGDRGVVIYTNKHKIIKSPPPSYIGNKIQRTLGCLFNLLPEYSIFLLR